MRDGQGTVTVFLSVAICVDVSSDFQTPRSRLEKRGAAEVFF